MSFTIKQFNRDERLGEKLKALRKEACLTLLEMEHYTKIGRSTLALLEAGEFARLPDPIYTRNFIKIYIRTLGADEAYYLNLYEQERGTCDFITQARLPRQRARALKFLVASRFIKFGGFSLIAGAVVFYLGLQVRSIVSPPALSIVQPTDGMITYDATIPVTGEVQDDASVQVNGSQVLLNKDGTFVTEVALQRGLNLITIESAKRYSRTSVEYRRVILEQERTLSIAPTVDK